jgi:uncharacterized protein YbjT (DUF2867 family)
VTPGPVLVFGATGTHGGAVARELLLRAIPVRALVRDPHSKRAQALERSGAELVVGDLRDERSVAQAMSGVAAAYAITTPFEEGPDAEVRQGQAVIGAALEARLPWLILASVAATSRADVPHFQSKAQIEERLREAPVPWTVVAPSYFYENVLGSRAAILEGLLPLPLPPDKPVHQVRLRDLGAVVAAILERREEHLSQRVEIAGDAPTLREMAGALGARPVEASLNDLRERSPDLAALYSFLAEDGYGIDVAAVRARYPEVDWMSFAEWAAEVEWDSLS